jgi:hypothetical protein
MIANLPGRPPEKPVDFGSGFVMLTMPPAIRCRITQLELRSLHQLDFCRVAPARGW